MNPFEKNNFYMNANCAHSDNMYSNFINLDTVNYMNKGNEIEAKYPISPDASKEDLQNLLQVYQKLSALARANGNSNLEAILNKDINRIKDYIRNANAEAQKQADTDMQAIQNLDYIKAAAAAAGQGVGATAKTGMSSGAKIGLVIGGVAFLGIVVFMLVKATNKK